MRFIETRPSGKDKDIPVYVFAFGKEELKLLYGITINAKFHLPEMIELSQMKHRLSNIIREFRKVLEN